MLNTDNGIVDLDDIGLAIKFVLSPQWNQIRRRSAELGGRIGLHILKEPPTNNLCCLSGLHWNIESIWTRGCDVKLGARALKVRSELSPCIQQSPYDGLAGRGNLVSKSPSCFTFDAFAYWQCLNEDLQRPTINPDIDGSFID